MSEPELPGEDVQLENDLAALMSTPWGRRLMLWLIEEHGQVREPPTDWSRKYNLELESKRHEGWADNARELDKLVRRLLPDHYWLMKSEQAQAQLTAARWARASTEPKT